MSSYDFIRKDRNKLGSGIVFYTNNQLPGRTMKIENPSGIEIMTIERTIHIKNQSQYEYK